MATPPPSGYGSDSQDGVFVRNVRKFYGKFEALKDINCTIDKGSIYALLGASGCGKTTLLKILLGRHFADEGEVLVLGKAPTTPGHSVPGSGVGYAPQEIALYPDLTIHEILKFHATLHLMSSQEFEERKKYLLEMLDLKDPGKLIRNLSGGQQRRVSLAIALLHTPDLLILDEPTVGVDVMLRLRIWEYLKVLSTHFGVTVVITTHYVEEARFANRVGFMRNGQILVENAPQNLLHQYGATNLEDVFLQVCRDVIRRRKDKQAQFAVIEDEDGKTKKKKKKKEKKKPKKKQDVKLIDPATNAPINDDSSPEKKVRFAAAVIPPPPPKSEDSESEDEVEENADDFADWDEKKAKKPLIPKPVSRKQKGFCATKPRQILGVIRRKMTQIVRNPILISWELIVPTVQIVIFMLAIGQQPQHLPVVVVNQDVGYNGQNYGDLFVNEIAANQTLALTLITNKTVAEGIDLITLGQAWATVVIPENFTMMIQNAVMYNITQIVSQTQIQLYCDLSNYQVGLTVFQKLGESVQELLDNMFEQALPGTPVPRFLQISPIYGSMNGKFTDFLAPGVITLITFANSIGSTAMAFVIERTSGSLDRVWAAGVTAVTFIIGHLITHSLILVLQTGILLIISIFAFKVVCVGSVGWVFLLVFSLGLVGQSYGLFISSIASTESSAVQMALSTFFPAILISGVMWPVEAIPTWFNWLPKIIPTTWVVTAVRVVMLRGWDIRNQDVWLALIVCFGWGVVLMGLAAIKLSSQEWRCSACRGCCPCCTPPKRKSKLLDDEDNDS